MGVIYKARDRQGGGRSDQARPRVDRDNLARFEREATILSELSHPDRRLRRARRDARR